MTEFKKAKKIDLFDGNGNLWKMKGVVNEENEREYFNTVSDGYNIVQHEEVVEMVEEAIKDKNLKVRTAIDNLNDGARLHMELTFPEITLDVEGNGQQISLRCSYDNSYDGTTGLRLEVGAESPYGGGFLWVGGLVKALEDNYYHRHTKGVNVKEFEKKLEKGINSFQTKIKEHFMQMFKTPVTSSEAISFLDDAMEVKGVTKLYLESIKNEVNKSTIKNKWQLYCLVCDTLTKEASSLDVRNRQLALVVARMHKAFKSNDKKIDASPSNDGGVTLKEVVENNIQSTKLPEGVICLSIPTIPQKLTIERKGKRKFAIMQGDTEIKTFKKYKQASKFLQAA